MKRFLVLVTLVALLVGGIPVASAQSGVQLVTFEVRKDGVSLGGGSILNYTGQGVNVISLGGGQFTINIPGEVVPTPTQTPNPIPPPPPPDYGSPIDLPGWGWIHYVDYNWSIMEGGPLGSGICEKKNGWVTLSTGLTPGSQSYIQRRVVYDGISFINLAQPMAFTTQVTIKEATPGGTFMVRWGHSGPVNPSSLSFGFKVDGNRQLYGVLFWGLTYSQSLTTQDLGITLDLNKSYVLSAAWVPGYGARFWVNAIEQAPIVQTPTLLSVADNNKVWYGVRNDSGGTMSVEARFVEIWQKL